MLEELTGTRLVAPLFFSHSGTAWYPGVLSLKQSTDLADKSRRGRFGSPLFSVPDSVRCFPTSLSHTIPLTTFRIVFVGRALDGFSAKT